MPEKSGIEARLCVRPSAWGRGAASCPKASGAAAAAHIPMKKCRSTFMFPSLLMICLCSWAIGNLERIAAGLKHLVWLQFCGRYSHPRHLNQRIGRIVLSTISVRPNW